MRVIQQQRRYFLFPLTTQHSITTTTTHHHLNREELIIITIPSLFSNDKKILLVLGRLHSLTLLEKNDTYLAAHYLRSEESKESPLFLFSTLTTTSKVAHRQDEGQTSLLISF